MLKSISLPKGLVKKSTSLILNSNKLTSTINIVGTKIVYKEEDGKVIKTILERNLIPFN
jgi:hypothetical protein